MAGFRSVHPASWQKRKKLRRYSRRLRADNGEYGQDARNVRSAVPLPAGRLDRLARFRQEIAAGRTGRFWAQPLARRLAH
jgi:hypothetical protein